VNHRRRVLVTGGAGFLGRPLVDGLAREGCVVTVLDRGSDLDLPGADRVVRGDFADEASRDEALRGQSVIYHLACSTVPATSAREPRRDVEENVLGSVALFEAAAAAGVEKIVYPSSGGTVYGIARETPITEDHPTRPINVHGVSKLAVERYLEVLAAQHGFTATILRVANPYGPGQGRRASQGVIAALLRCAASGSAMPIWGDGSVVRDYLFIDDVVDALARTRLAGDGETLNVGSGVGRSLLDLVAAVELVTDREVTVESQPARGFDVPVNVLDPSRAAVALDWRARVALEDGIGRTWALVERAHPSG